MPDNVMNVGYRLQTNKYTDKSLLAFRQQFRGAYPQCECRPAMDERCHTDACSNRQELIECDAKVRIALTVPKIVMLTSNSYVFSARIY